MIFGMASIDYVLWHDLVSCLHIKSLEYTSTHPWPGLYQQKYNQHIKGCDYSTLLIHLLGHTWNTVCSFGLPTSRDILKLGRI